MKGLRYPLIAVAIVSFFLVSSQTAFAATTGGTPGGSGGAFYIDPGTGSIMIQALIGVLVGGLAMMGIYRVRVKMFLANLFNRRKGDEESE